MSVLDQINSLFNSETPFLAVRTPGGTIDIFYPSNTNDWGAMVSNFDHTKSLRFSHSPDPSYDIINESIAPPYCSTFEDYKRQFEGIQENIRSGVISKAILSRIMTIEGKTNKPVTLFQLLENAYSDACVYILHMVNTTWLGATPELLASENKGLTTCASLAGTLPLNNEPWSPKELEEQNIVSEFIASKFNKHGELISRIGPKDKIAGKVRHLFTQFTGKVDNHDDFLMDLHPTPAISGFPQNKAIDLIQSIEQHDRSWYTGYLRFRTHNEDLAYVNLRCMQIIEGQAYLYLGGGITADSILEKEWKETEMKAQTLRSVMQKL